MLVGKVYLNISVAYIIVLASRRLNACKVKITGTVIDRVYLVNALALFKHIHKIVTSLFLIYPPAVFSISACRHDYVALQSGVEFSLSIICIILLCELFHILHGFLSVHSVASVIFELYHLHKLLARESFCGVVKIVCDRKLENIISFLAIVLKVCALQLWKRITTCVLVKLNAKLTCRHALRNISFKLFHIGYLVSLHLRGDNISRLILVKTKLCVGSFNIAPVCFLHKLLKLLNIKCDVLIKAIDGVLYKSREPCFSVHAVIDLLKLVLAA